MLQRSDEESEDDFELSETDQRYLQEAYEDFSHYASPRLQKMEQGLFDYRAPFADASHAQDWFDKLRNLPDSWPLMRILVPLEGLSLQVERIIACVAAELVATHQAPHTQNKFVKRVAKKLTAFLASYLAGEVVGLLSPVAAVDHREMVPPLYQPLLTPVYWIRPIYTELLHAASRIKKDTRTEVARPSNG